MRPFSVVVAAAMSATLAWGAKNTASEPEIKSLPLRTHTLQQPYLDTDMQSRWFDFGGDTIIKTDSYIRLTSDLPSQTGWLFSRVPLTATNWEIELEFRISGKNQLYGDGFAMWITKQRAQPGTVFGHADKFEGLGVFIDTYKNNRPGVIFPYISVMFGDGQTMYDKASDGKGTELAGCSVRGLRHAMGATKLRLTYFQDKQLKLETMYRNDEWHLCFDHSSPPTIPNISYLGFSAETGELTDNHDIISVETRNLYTNPAINAIGTSSRGRNKAAEKSRNADGRSGGSWSWFFMKIIFFLMVVGGAYVGYTVYRTRSKTHRF